jgi:hypothetical protein
MLAAASRAKQEAGFPASEGPIKLPISDVLGPDGHTRLRGYYMDPSNPGAYLPVDFEGGTITAVVRSNNGSPQIYTMYPNPVEGRHP